MKIKAHILLNLISFFVALFAFPAMAQQYNIIYDVFTNENYSYQSKFKEIKDVGLNLNDENSPSLAWNRKNFTNNCMAR